MWGFGALATGQTTLEYNNNNMKLGVASLVRMKKYLLSVLSNFTGGAANAIENAPF